MQPRTPTEQEKKELIDLVTVTYGKGDEFREDATGIVESACIAVFDEYVYGKIMVVVYDGGASQTETYIWERHILEEEQYIPLGQINWHDGKHEPKLEKVEIDN